jgi:hypothetical protein
VRDGYKRQVTELAEEIGPAQLADGTLWFAKTFYDDEGTTGVGGFGFFDPQTKRYKVYSPPAVLDWSATAILVERESVWIALSSRSEYRNTSGGLLRFDRGTETCTKVALPDITREMTRVGDSLILATDFGAAILRDGKLRRYFVDRTLRGDQLQVSEAVVGE